LFDQLSKPEYLHVILNHFPLTGLMVAVVGLVLALFWRARGARVIALVLIAFCSASALPVYLTGKSGYRNVRRIADDQGMDRLDEHLDRAEAWAWVYIPVFSLAVAALCIPERNLRLRSGLMFLTLASAAAAIGVGFYIAEVGGQVRHPEFRVLAPPAEKEN
jgi:hypothetical protein